MSFKEWTAVVQLVGQGVVLAWLVLDAASLGGGDWTAAAVRCLWAIGFMIVFNIVTLILVAIGISIIRREEFKEERADERDRAVANKSYRNAYYAVSVGGLATLVLLATGQDPALAVYGMFGALMLGGTADAVSQLVYYRIG